MRILVLGAGVIGSVYAGALRLQGHDVVLLARGQRLLDLQTHGLILLDAESGRRTTLQVPAVGELAPGDEYDVIIVPVRHEQLTGTIPLLTGCSTPADGCDVLFFGNAAGRRAELTSALGGRAMFGFPAVGGVREGSVIRYVRIGPQRTTLGEPDGATTPRIMRLQAMFAGAGFRTRISNDIDGWLLGHAAFIVPIAAALDKVKGSAPALAAHPGTLRLMVHATREAFAALSAAGNAEIPANLRLLYRLPHPLIAHYWRRLLSGPRGELWFGAHTRAAPTERRSLAAELQAALRRTGAPAPALTRLLARSS
jgi:2-dehydropantoate 2-reductase